MSYYQGMKKFKFHHLLIVRSHTFNGAWIAIFWTTLTRAPFCYFQNQRDNAK